MPTITVTLTTEQAELCKTALLKVKVTGDLPQIIQAVELMHGTIKVIDDALKAAANPAPTPSTEAMQSAVTVSVPEGTSIRIPEAAPVILQEDTP